MSSSLVLANAPLGDSCPGFAVPFAKLEPLLREAVALLSEGFAVPVSGGANTPPSALMLSHLQHAHKDFYEFMAKGEKVNWEE